MIQNSAEITINNKYYLVTYGEYAFERSESFLGSQFDPWIMLDHIISLEKPYP